MHGGSSGREHDKAGRQGNGDGRVVVFGGGGFFGGAIIERLLADGIGPTVAVARRPLSPLAGVTALVGDVESSADVRRILRRGDVVIDAVGPFHARSMVLLEAALEAGADYLDLNDSPVYAEKVVAYAGRIAAAGVRVLTSCSSISVVPVAFTLLCKVEHPSRITMLLAPETRFTARPGAAASLLATLHQPVRLQRDKQVVGLPGWSLSRLARLPTKRGRGRYYLFAAADYVHVPRVFPGIVTVEFFVSSGVPLLDQGLTALSQLHADGLPYRLLTHPRLQRAALPLVRRFGRAGGAIGGEIVGADGSQVRFSIAAASRGYIVPVVPAVIATRHLLAGEIAETGLIPHDRQVDPVELLRYLRALGFKVTRSPSVVRMVSETAGTG